MTRIRLGMVGGGKDAFIGAVHRIAARIDGEYDLVAGALSSTPEKSRDSGVALGLDADRCYGSFEEMAEAEAGREDGIEAVAIVTPNHVHGPAAAAFLRRGIHVICDKPLTATMEQAAELEAAIRVVQVEYAQDWLTEPAEQTGTNKQAEWRTDPERSGAGGSIGDIGTHAYNLACFVTGLSMERLSADLQSFVPGRRVDDNAHVMLRFGGGARGMLWCSQVAPGNENGLRLRVYGEKGGLEWAQEDPNYLWFTPFGEAKRLLTRRGAGAMDAANAVSRTPGGHPEGYLEGFANIYTGAAQAIRAAQAGQRDPVLDILPGLEEGLAGMRFIDACIRSARDDAAWVTP